MVKRASEAPALMADAASALMELWSPGSERAFKRQSDTKSTGSTSSPRATLALVDALRHADFWGDRSPVLLSPLVQRTKVIDVLLGRANLLADQHGLQRQRNSGINDQNDFTDAHLALEMALLARLASRDGAESGALLKLSDTTRTLLQRHSKNLVKSIAKKLRENHSAKLAGTPHHFVTYHAFRAIDFILQDEIEPDLIKSIQMSVETSVLTQIAHHTSGSEARFDLAGLVFGIGLLDRFATYYAPIVSQGLQIVCERQALDGSWPELRTISDGRRALFITSYEVGLTLANLAVQKVGEAHRSGTKLAMSSIGRVLDLATVERRPLPYGSHGWANDRNPDRERVETWTTAVVCSLAARYQTAANLMHVERCFNTYDPASFKLSPTKVLWRDLAVYDRVSSRATVSPKSAQDLRISDPTDEGDLAESVFQQFIAPVATSWVERTGPLGRSILLPGEPGTRKTTLVRELARGIGWPLLILSPPVFLREGLDRFESVAADVFKDLQRLDRIVVFFDECEEFFRKREPASMTSANRTIGAFITAGMLPRLQDLHDRGNIIFVVATNARLTELDPAAIRAGRFDLRREMLQPRRAAQKRYLRKCLESRGVGKRVAESGLKRIYDLFDGDLKDRVKESVTFGELDDIAGLIALKHTDRADVERVLTE